MKDKTKKHDNTIITRILNNKVYPVIFLVIIVFIAVTIVMVISNFTMAKILYERDAAIIAEFKNIFPDFEKYKYKEDYYEIYGAGDITGYAFVAEGNGYGGAISILVGINKDFIIQKISVLSNTETPGLGSRVAEDFFTDQFKGLTQQDIRLSKDGGKIDAITGATISSTAVTEAVRQSLEVRIEEIKKDQ